MRGREVERKGEKWHNMDGGMRVGAGKWGRVG